MARPLNILFLSSEAEPFAKTGGLADVAGALPLTIKALGHEIRVMMPRYGSINERRQRLHEMIRLREIPVPVGKESRPAQVKSSFLANNHLKVQVYFLDNPHLFGRPGLYIHPDTKKDYPDNDERFIFFARGVLEVLKQMGWQPDIIHCNEWQTGLVPAYLKTLYRDDPFYKHTRSVFTIHNMAYQGVFPKSSFAKTGLPAEVYTDKGLEHRGSMNMLKAGLVYADALTTVSQKYAEEIRGSEEFGFGLQDVVARRKDSLSGILNGIEYSVWNPAVDEVIPVKYDPRTLDLKAENKRALQERMGLPVRADVPLLGVISRLADQKGFDLLEKILPEMMAMDLQLVVLGTGQKEYHTMLEKAAKKYPQKMAVLLGFDDELAHWIEAGCDIFLMPSRYEPCGLNQMYSLKYGTVPVVRATGGLDDTIDDVNTSRGTGTGYKFERYEAGELLDAIRRALAGYANHTLWRKIMKNGMASDYSWEASARQYIHLYRGLSKK
jgi:starch synthase